MRVIYPNIDRAKKATKGLKSALLGVPLSDAQSALAHISGFRDWHELNQFHKENHKPKTLPVEDERQLAVILCLKLAEELNITWSDALYALSEAYIPDVNLKTEGVYDVVWLEIMRKKHNFSNQERTIGSIANLESEGFNIDDSHYIKDHSMGPCLISHGSIKNVADFEIITPKSPLPFFVPARLVLPYGCYIEADGAKVLHSRDYMPLWRIKENKKPERMDPWIWINYVDHKYFWGDTSAPWHSKETFAQEQEILHSFGINALPKLADILPELIFNPNIQSIGDAVNAIIDELPPAEKALAWPYY